MATLRINNAKFIVLRNIALLALCIIVSISYTPSAFAWNGPHGSSPDVAWTLEDYHNNKEMYKKYLPLAHAYIIQHAIDILENEGYRNYAGIARQYLPELLNGCRFADEKYGNAKIYLRVDFLGIKGVEFFLSDLFGIAGQGHFLNPKRFKPNALKIEDGDTSGLLAPEKAFMNGGIKIGNDILDALQRAGAEWIGGLVTLGVDPDIVIEPEDLRTQFRSAIENFNLAYKEAINSWKIGRYWESMFFLGEALHLVTDMAVYHHTDDENFKHHRSYERSSKNKGFDTQFNAESDKDLLKYGPADPWRFLLELASKIHSDDVMKNQVYNENYESSLKKAIPLAEQYTARLIKRFFIDRNVNPKGSLVWGYVYSSGRPLPGAYVFYKEAECKERWNWIQTNSQGIYQVRLVHTDKYWLRPAMPGFIFEGVKDFGGYVHKGGKFEKKKYAEIEYSLDQRRKDFNLEPLPNKTGMMKQTGPSAGKDQMSVNVKKALQKGLPITPVNEWAIGHGYSSAPHPGFITDEMADEINNALIQMSTEESNLLDVENGETEYPETTVVKIQLGVIANLKTGDVIQTPNELEAVVTAASIKSVEPMGKSVKPINKSVWKKLVKMLPQEKFIDPTGKERKAVSLVGFSDLNNDHPQDKSTLLRQGLVKAIPKQGVKIAVDIAEHWNLVGTQKSMVVTTNDMGRAFVKIKTGSNPGPITLRATVIENPTALRVKPQAVIRIMAQPNSNRLDLDPPKFPVLSQLYPKETMVEGGVPKRTAGYNIRVENRKIVDIIKIEGIADSKYAPNIKGAEIAKPANTTMEQNIDRAGMDYKSFDLQVADPDLCREACEKDPKCQAYTYVKPGVQGPKARCWLKHSIPPAKKNSCCVSGVRKAIPVVSPYLKAVQPPKAEMGTGYVTDQRGGQQVDLSGKWNSNIGLVYNINQNRNKISYQDPLMHKPVNGTVDGKTVTVSWVEGNAVKNLKGTIISVGNDGKAKRIEWENRVVYHRNGGKETTPIHLPSTK